MIKKVAIAAAITAAGVAGYMTQTPKEKPIGAVKQMIKQAKGKKLYYAYKKSNLGKKSLMLSVPAFDGAKVNSKGIVTFSATDEEVKSFKTKPKMLGEDWVVVEERIYSKDFTCSNNPSPMPDPGEPPPLDPPSDDPGTWPNYSDRTDWGVKKTYADKALQFHRGSSVTVCVIDTGADYFHPDLKGVLVEGGKSLVPGAATAQDDEGHGSHVAGIIASKYDNSGMGGASQARIRPFKALDNEGSGASSWLMNALIEAADSGCQVISNSWGSAYEYGPDRGITDAIQYAVSKGAILAFAAGNDGKRTGWPAAHATMSPNIYAVSASGPLDGIAYFSSRGPEISVMAPGLMIESIRLGGGYVSMSGTSMATPYIAAGLAMMIESGQSRLGYDDANLSSELQGLGRINFLKTIGE